ncbi:30S ribosomal protein S9 [Candidatus Peribacteria bacterium]|nr:30S ribosomal protein S9 [Candidatus Peribacteria bacterium]
MAASRPFFYGLGKRKSAIARVRLFQEGVGKVMVNDDAAGKYFFSTHTENALSPLAITEQSKKVDIEAFVEGGGKVAQSDAIRLGISRALVLMDPALRSMLKQAGFLRRDSRIKERKKPGLHRARRAPQFAKR